MAKDDVDLRPLVKAIEDQTREIKKLRESVDKMVKSHIKALAFLDETPSNTSE